MSDLGVDIVKSTDSEIALSSLNNVGAKILIWFLAAGFTLIIVMFIGLSIEEAEFPGCVLGLLVIIVPITLLLWQLPVFPQETIQFNRPVGYLTIIIPYWYSFFIPFGPLFITKSEQIPLPSTPAMLNDTSFTVRGPAQISPTRAIMTEGDVKWRPHVYHQ